MVMDEVSEALPAPDVVGREFVRQYYTLLNNAPEQAHRFYNSNSLFVHGSMMKPAIGQLEIHRRIQQLKFRDCHAKISQVDSQVTLGNGVVVQVSGELSNAGLPMRRFSQTFVLGTQSPKKYYVHNDIFRYQDTLQSDEEPENLQEKDEAIETEETYYQSGATEQLVAPQQQQPPASQQPPLAAINTTAPPLHPVNVNGTGGHHHEEPEVLQQAPPLQQQQQQQPQQPRAVVNVEPAPVHVEPVVAAPAPPIVNGGTIDPVQPVQPEPVPVALNRPVHGHSTSEESSPPSAPEVNNKDSYEEDSYQPQIIDANGGAKPTFASCVRVGHRGAPPQRSARPPPSSAPVPSAGSAPSAQFSSQNQQSAHAPQHHPPPRGGPDRSDLGSSDISGGPPSGLRSYPDANQVFLGNVPLGASDSDLKPVFEEFGVVKDIRINRGRDASKNFGFVIFDDPSSVAQCLKAKQVKYNDYVINVEEKRKRGTEGGWSSMGRGQSGRGGRAPRGAPRGSFNRGPSAPHPQSTRSPYPPKR